MSMKKIICARCECSPCRCGILYPLPDSLEAAQQEAAGLRVVLARLLGRRLTDGELAEIRRGKCPESLSLDQSITAALRAQARRLARGLDDTTMGRA